MNLLANRARMWFALLLVLALVAAACGGEGETTTTAGATDTTQAEEASDTTQAEEGSDTTQAEEAGGELTPITFALTNQRAIQYAEFYAADALGFFEEED